MILLRRKGHLELVFFCFVLFCFFCSPKVVKNCFFESSSLPLHSLDYTFECIFWKLWTVGRHSCLVTGSCIIYDVALKALFNFHCLLPNKLSFFFLWGQINKLRQVNQELGQLVFDCTKVSLR